jgi:hypothetical protein
MPHTDITYLQKYDALFTSYNSTELAPFIESADGTIAAYTGRSIPESAATANAFLRNIANGLILWEISGTQGKLDEQEYKRREAIYRNSMKSLELIRNGDITLPDADPTPSAGVTIASTKRMDSYL